MNIKEVEKITEISSQNIRYYERAGLITPKRNHVNDYRIYEESDIQRLKMIKVLRMLGMTIDMIKLVLNKELQFGRAFSGELIILLL